MIRRQPLPLAADRWTPFGCTLRFTGLDLTGAQFLMQVREFPDQTGIPLISLGTVLLSTAQGIRLISVDDSGPVPVSLVGIHISETTIEGVLPPGTSAQPIGSDIRLYWDMHITRPAGLKQRYLEGPFIIRAGVTQ